MIRRKLIAGGGDSLVEAMMNTQNKLEIVPTREKCLFVIADRNILPFAKESDSEGKDWERFLFRGEPGGTIVFSTDVNSKVLSDNSIKNRILQVYETYKNRFFAKRILDRIRRRHSVYAWTIGQYLIGTYTGDVDGKTYNENSLSIDVIGIDKDMLFKIAKDLLGIFNQESVLVKWNGKVYFVK